MKRDVFQRGYELRWILVDFGHIGEFDVQALSPPLDAILKPLEEGPVYSNRDQTHRHDRG
jgi:hypothetical protein